ncbi:zinc finger protein 43-like isoform X2 [Belonocnema kinseyi]|uniref:zinc finger protein 43-like isoform X2 n=1 Tax=Belonocnema kinseyi TaxID=2817044 RepID=UPI00143DC384|nr:zinc finger protein 43-like isoform X2 [Belonocnema kinseyi]
MIEIEYCNDETLEIKEEIMKGNSNSDITKTRRRSTRGRVLNLQRERSNDEALEIKEEIIENQGTSDQTRIKKYDANFCAVYIRETADLAVIKQLPTHKKQRIQESEQEAEKKNQCKKCARSYRYKQDLERHKKLECEKPPQFKCKFCDKRFKQKCHMDAHVGRVHHKINLKTSVLSYNCDKCFRSYTLLKNLYRHKRLDHSEVKRQFICDFCGHKANQKSHLSSHISSRHLKK